MAAVVACWLAGSSNAEAQTFRYTSSGDFAGGTSTTVVERTAGQLELADAPIRRGNVVWSDNYLYGYIVRFDATTGRQIGRYDTVLAQTAALPAGQGLMTTHPANEFCDFSTTSSAQDSSRPVPTRTWTECLTSTTLMTMAMAFRPRPNCPAPRRT